jgi:hypothetical protein
MLSPRQKRNQPGTVELPAQLPQSSTEQLLGGLQAAMATSMAANDARQAAAKAWMNHSLRVPTVAGDRQPTHSSHAGHVGEVLGVGQSPAHDLLPPVTDYSRLPDPAPAAPAVSSSGTRPKGMAGLQFNQRPLVPPSPGPQSFSKGSVVYVSTDTPGGRTGGLFAALRRLFGGAK